jgi:hypothetical protein
MTTGLAFGIGGPKPVVSTLVYPRWGIPAGCHHEYLRPSDSPIWRMSYSRKTRHAFDRVSTAMPYVHDDI